MMRFIPVRTTVLPLPANQLGSVTAARFAEAGAQVIAVSDSLGAVMAENGLDVSLVIDHKTATGSVVGTPDTKTLSNDDLLALDCDVLIPSALGGAIHLGNVDKVSAILIVEAANNPVTPEANEVLSEKQMQVLPDIVANAVGVTVSYFEWVQNLANERWNIEDIDKRLRDTMRQATDSVVDRWQRMGTGSEDRAKHDYDLRTAALVVAIERVTGVTNQRGIWP
jgi:glutamate dehydrogenase (NAD(P)+)